MEITSVCKLVKDSVVAFTLKYIPVYNENVPPPAFPPILGTGFVVREDGVIATNAHVVREFYKVKRPPTAPKDEWAISVLMLKNTERGMLQIPLEIVGVAVIREFDPGKVYYGPKEGPDLAFVQVKAIGLPTVRIDSKSILEEGMEVATVGFPMGCDALTAPGWLHQVTPTFQKGIVSAVLPFACPTPHAYSINVMAQGGASGSPVFLCETGEVVGILYAGLNDLAVTLKHKDFYKVPTNISYVVPSHYLAKVLDEISNDASIKPHPEAITLEDMIKQAEVVNFLKDESLWITKEVDLKAEAARVSQISRITPDQHEILP